MQDVSQSFHEVWEGFTKNMWPAFEGSHLKFLIIGFLQLMVFVVPFALSQLWLPRPTRNRLRLRRWF